MKLMDSTPSEFTGDPRFTGTAAGVHVMPGDPQLHAYSMRFEPGGRTAWHSHERGQLLICTAGSGWVGIRDGQLLKLAPGVIVWTEAGEEHWHGASAGASMEHIAVQTETPEADRVVWRDALSDNEFAGGVG
ncbi:cupin domain-containing protein [Flexivirga caeni]|uniref:Cupin domain-containing protein n=1 Tax=Flexivirga caeni TaxID=2294115 RepID=A0A3M9MCI9_9MICO|nr:cupin domain-containing protein [Flexivirga caeni]RNI23282.1 cupin domain-containing protein [Flexivirga caeni]